MFPSKTYLDPRIAECICCIAELGGILGSWVQCAKLELSLFAAPLYQYPGFLNSVLQMASFAEPKSCLSFILFSENIFASGGLL